MRLSFFIFLLLQAIESGYNPEVLRYTTKPVDAIVSVKKETHIDDVS